MGEGKGNSSSMRGMALNGGGRGTILLSVVVAMVRDVEVGSS